MRGLLFFIPVALLLVHSVVNAAATKTPLQVQELTDFTVPKGQVIYQRYCLFCHGEKGEGDGQNAFSLAKRPSDFTLNSTRTDEKIIFAVIEQGGEKNNLSPDMPSFEKTLSQQRTRLLVEYIQSFAQSR